MAVPVLVVTPNPGFGELICQILEEAGGYVLSLTTNSNDAIAVMKKKQPAICIIDSDLDDVPLADLARSFRSEGKDLQVILIPSDEEKDANWVEAIQPDGFLSKPFYLPDLVSTVADVVHKSGVENMNRVNTGADASSKAKGEGQSGGKPAPEWLKDVSQAAQHLTRLALESSSQASLVIKQGQVWAYAGELPQPAVEELAQTVSRYIKDGGSSDLAQYIHLDATGGEHMLYATEIGGEFVLAMVFDAELPFSRIRHQANTIAKALASNTPPDLNEDLLQFEDKADEESEKLFSPLLDDVPPPIPGDWVPDASSLGARAGFLEELIAEDAPVTSQIILEPEIPEADKVLNWMESEISQIPVEEDEIIENETDQTDKFEFEIEEGQIYSQEGLVGTFDIENPETVEDISVQDETMLSPSLQGKEVIEETVLSVSSREGKEVKLEPVSAAVYNLTYGCVLISRLPDHFLTGHLADSLSDWINQLCLAFGWRLEHLSIRPDYLQWLVNVPPATSPGYLMQIIRQHTSRRLFVEFPRMEDENPSGDFWAPGYLIMSGNQPPPHQLVKDFIKKTRKRQGISK